MLFDRDGATLLDTVACKDQRSDVSYGRFPSGGDSWRYMMVPTPGSLNVAAYEGVVADTKFSHDRGFYEEPFAVTITTKTPGAQIYYTLDGSSPLDIARNVPMGRAVHRPDPHHHDDLSAGRRLQAGLAADEHRYAHLCLPQ